MNGRKQLSVAVVLACLVATAVRGQEQSAETADAQPTSAPAEKPNRLLTPYRAMAFFLETVGRDEEGEQKYRDAMVCLDFGDMDAEELKLKGPQYVEKLAAILERLEQEGYLDPQDTELFPDEPKLEGSTLVSFGRDPLVLKLARIARIERDEAAQAKRTVQEWRFAASTVAEIPTWHDDLDRLITEMAAPQQVPPVVADGAEPIPDDALSSPWHTVTFFLDKARDAQDDPQVYKAAFVCMDFSAAAREALQKELGIEDAAQVDAALEERGTAYLAEFQEKHGIEYVDGLARLLQAMLDGGTLRLDDLEKELGPEHKGTYSIGDKSLDMDLIRQSDGRWLFGRAAVGSILKQVAKLTRVTTAPPAEPPSDAGPATPSEQGEVGAAPAVAGRPVSSYSKAPKEYRSARATLRSFRRAMQAGDLKTAVRCLDVSALSEAERAFAHVLAGKLWLVMIRTERVPDAQVADDPGGDAYELLARTAGRIEIDRAWVKDRPEEWLFTQRTVRDIENLYEAFQREPLHKDWEGERLPSLHLREYVVPGALKRSLGPLQLWQWIGLLLVIVLGICVRIVCQVLLPRISRWLLQAEGAAMLPRALSKATRPTSNLLMVAAWWGLLQSLDLGGTLMSRIWPVLRVVMAVVAVLAFYRFVDVVMGYFTARASRTQSRLDDVLVPLLQKTLKVIVVAVGCVFVATAFGFQVTPLLAGLGVGGLAISFAAKDTIANFFGSVNVVLDRQRLFVDIIRVAKRLGVEFAFPTRTIHLAGDGETVAPTDQTALQAQVRAGQASIQAPRRASVPNDVENALAFGRETAAAIVAEVQCDTSEKPPPVTF